ncbi:NADH dehydrogenase (ubiquinone) 1 alpha subcomplex 9 [Tremella mesenterica]|uniref:NADH dehydrogenase (Ubiquinone) 1 alpha subcomplex 9 n=1 Tax=Tremella mesenterica TaxID=5217 RepID=A0A4Q1BIG4_TREME|nr:uncharacterized protein TREMEDRAFT_72592 [Tremella mesenterica DSM 1558]EIW65481.1 hypothetical protein TREMEDRAFT_72592 [Tremella mesenterica DSM 1558]RXK37424.1 NADH dehydrogenase (ubiquinone) 1 alpha subcomplex 9 [Tremella mesenterica]
MALTRLGHRLRAPVVSFRRTATPRRGAHDLIVEHSPSSHTPRPIIKRGPPTGGRSSVSGNVVTVFGCTGFLGRYTVAKIAKQGAQVIVPYRDEDEKRHLRVMGDLGQIVPMEWDARNPDQIYECVKHSDTVYNLAGRDWETKNFTFEDINVKAAGLIARVAAQANVPRLIHVSHLNASPSSTSEFYRTKYAGERAVREAFPEATIVRPAGMYGAEDWLLNAIAQYPILFKFNQGRTKILPVHVLDVASALSVMLTAPVTSVASTFALPGPAMHTFNSLFALTSAMTMRPVSGVPEVPKAVAKLVSSIIHRAIWWPVISPDEIERKFIDDMGTELFASPGEEKPSGWATSRSDGAVGIDGEPVKGWADLDISPDYIEEHAIKYLRRYRSASNYDRPVELGNLKPPKAYHVVP